MQAINNQEKQLPFTGPVMAPVPAYNYSPPVSEAARKLEMEYRLRHVLGLIELGVLTHDPHSPIVLVDTSKIDDNEPVDTDDDGSICGCNIKYVAVIVGMILCVAGLCIALQYANIGSSRAGGGRIPTRPMYPDDKRSLIMRSYSQQNSRLKNNRYRPYFQRVFNNSTFVFNSTAMYKRPRLNSTRRLV